MINIGHMSIESNTIDAELDITLNLGDIITLYDPTNDIINQQTFSIEYIDKERMHLLNVQDFTHTTLKIDATGVIQPGTIESIDLLYRNPEKGYARQNKLLPGTWLNIYFGGETPVIVTGEITNLEEDMIEITTYPDNDILYINFAYQGIPLGLPIEQFEIRRKPERKEQDREEREEGREGREEGREGREEGREGEEDFPTKTEMKRGEDIILRASDIFFGQTLSPLRQEINVASSKERFNLETQTNDLLEDLLSSIPKTQRTTSILQSTHINIERFKQLRSEFSKLDEYGNVIGKRFKGPQWKPLVDHLHQLDTSLYWIVPVVKNKKKVYNITSAEDFPDIVPLTMTEDLLEIDASIEKYKSNTGSQEQNKYTDLLLDWQPLFIPFEDINPEMTRDILYSLPVKTNFNVIVNNLDDFTSSVVKDGSVSTRRFVLQRYTTSSRNESADTMQIKSLVTLPEPFVRFSHIQLPGSSLYLRSNLHLAFLQYWKLFKSKKIVMDVYLDTIEPQTNTSKNREKNIPDTTFLDDIKHYVYNHPQISGNETLYRNYLNTIVPKTRSLFHSMKKFIQGKLSFVNAVGSLEPFLVYTGDITYTLYVEIIRFVNEQISKYNKQFIEKGRQFISLKKMSSLSIPIQHKQLEFLFHKNPQQWSHLMREWHLETAYKSNSELLTDIMRDNAGRLLYYAISLENINTMIPENISSILTEEKRNKEDDKCISYIIAKQYDSIDAMEQDNGKSIYFDKKFDTTNYGILDDKNGNLDKKYEQAQKTMTPEAYLVFLTNQLSKSFDIREPEYMAQTLMDGMKRVVDGNLAIIYSIETDKMDYFKRSHNRWEKDDSIDPQTFANSQDLLCQFQNDCIQVEKEFIEHCQPINLNKRDVAKEAIKVIVKEFDEKYRVSKAELEATLHRQFDYCMHITPVLQDIREKEAFKYNLFQYQLGISSLSEELIVSPYLSLFHMIHGQNDFIKRQNDLVRFALRFTREAYSTEQEHWRYCVQTAVPLMPAFLYTLASSFIENPDNYIRTLDLVIQTNGVLSEDGDSWVDKHSGYIIRRIDFSTDEGYEDGYRVSSRETMELSAGDILQERMEEKVAQEKKYTSKEAKMAFLVVSSLADFMGIPVDAHIEWIIKTIVFTFPTAMPSESEYKIRAEEMAKKGKPMLPFKQIYNMTLLYLSMGAFFIGIQTSIPSIKTRKTFPGCVRSFTGYPMEGTGDDSGLKYLACVVYKIRSSDTEPWSALKGTKETVIITKLKEFIDRFYINQADVQRRYREKLDFLLLEPNDAAIPEQHNVVQMWRHFLPPLSSIQIKTVQPLSKDFKTTLMQEMRNGSHSQREKILIVESKILLFSLAIQERIQHCLQTKQLLLKNSANEPFLENACCHSSEKESTVAYFQREEPLLSQYNKMVSNLYRIIDDIKDIHSAPFLVSLFDTRNVYLPLDTQFAEEIIYRCFIQMCRFQSALPLREEFMAICSEKPSYLYSTDTIYDKIRKLKQDGKQYDNAALLHLLQMVHKNNIVHRIHGSELIIVSPMQRFRNVLETAIENPFLQRMSPLLGESLDVLLEQYDSFVEEDTDEMRECKNYLAKKNDAMQKQIFAFLNSYSTASKKEKRLCKDIIEKGMTWSDSSDSLYNSVSFMRMMLQNIVKTFPMIITKRVNYENIPIASYWRLSKNHENDLRRNVRESYSLLQPFYNSSLLSDVLDWIPQHGDDFLLLVQETLLFSDVEYKGISTHTIFDERTTLLLFEHYLLLSLIMYVEVGEYPSLLTEEEKEKEREEKEETDNDERIMQGNARDLREEIANLLVSYVRIFDKEKADIDISYERVMDVVFKIAEREKDTFTDRLKVLTEEAREIDTILKINQLGVWSKGLQKGLTTYVRETYDEERDYMEKLGDMERALRKKNNDINDSNIDIYMTEALEQMDVEAEIDEEVYNMSALNEAEDDGDYYNEYNDTGYDD